MAYGFQNTCDTEEYFYLDNVPGYVSVNEFFYIETLEGENFCGKYVDIPAVDYQILTYSLLGMTAQTNESLCQQINPCPTVLINFGNQNTTTSSINVCSCLTEYPLGVNCVVPNVTPQNPNVTVNLQITGGTAPYIIYSANTSNQLGSVSVNGGTSNISIQRPAGTYCFDVYDFYQTKVSHCCTVGTASTILSASYIKQNTNQCYNTGSVTVNINGGTPPYTVYRNGSSQGETTLFTGLGAGSNTFYVTDSSEPMQQTSLSTQNIAATTITYPSQICMSFTLCGQQFNLSFTKIATANCPPYYLCDNPNSIGAETFYLTGDTTTNNWGTEDFYVDASSLDLPSNCSLSSGTARFVKDTISPQAQGTYSPQGAFSNATNVIITNGACLITPTFTYQVVGTCSGLYQGVITITPSVTPFVATLDNIPRPQNQTVFSNLSEGNHTLFITSNGVQSSTQTINVPSTTNTNSSSSTCEVFIPGGFPPFNNIYTLSATRTYFNIPQGVTVTVSYKPNYILTLQTLTNPPSTSNFDFNRIHSKVFKNGVEIINIIGTYGAASSTTGPNTINIGSCILYNKDYNWTNTATNTITIQNNDALTFEHRFTLELISSETGNLNCNEYLGLQIQNVFLNVVDNSPSCFNFTNTSSVVSNVSITRNASTNNSLVAQATNYSECPSA